MFRNNDLKILQIVICIFRWANEAAKLKEKFENLAGDVLLASGVIAYLGPYTSHYRSMCITKWVDYCIVRFSFIFFYIIIDILNASPIIF